MEKAAKFLLIFSLISWNVPLVLAEDVYLRAPETLRIEHDQLHNDLEICSKTGGETGKAARKLQLLLRPHLYKEEKFTLPQLGLLNELVDGKRTVNAVEVIKLSQMLEKEMPLILAEHKAIGKAVNQLAETGERENKPEVAWFIKRLKMHAKYEEEIFYPSAILAGKYLMLKEQKNSPKT